MQGTDWSTLHGYHGSSLQMSKAHKLPLAEVITINFLIVAVVEGKGDKIAPLSFIALTINNILESEGRLNGMENAWNLIC